MTCVTGVSGSGKSTLINHTLYSIAANVLNRAKNRAHNPDVLHEGLQFFEKVVAIDQSPIGRTPRSNPATYTNIFSHIRELFANTKEARTRGYKAGRFSFNIQGVRRRGAGQRANVAGQHAGSHVPGEADDARAGARGGRQRQRPGQREVRVRHVQARAQGRGRRGAAQRRVRPSNVQRHRRPHARPVGHRTAGPVAFGLVERDQALACRLHRQGWLSSSALNRRGLERGAGVTSMRCRRTLGGLCDEGIGDVGNTTSVTLLR